VLAAPLGKPLVLGLAADGVLPALVEKGQLHKSFLAVRLGVHAAERPLPPVLAAVLAVEGKGDGVKNGGFARAGVAGNQVEPAVPQQGKIQRFQTRIGSKGRKGQFQRSHPCSSCARSKIPARQARSASSIARPFCLVKSSSNSSRGERSSTLSGVSRVKLDRVRVLSY